MAQRDNVVPRRVRGVAAAALAVAAVLLFDFAPAAVLILAPGAVIGLLARNRLPAGDARIAAAIASVPGALTYAVLDILDPEHENDIGYGLLFLFVCLLSILAAAAFVALRATPRQS